MAIFKGGALRLFQSALYFLEFCCAGLILAIFSYFLSVLANRHLPIATWEKAVEGLSGAAVVYLICATLLTCCLGGISFFAILAIILDLLFCGAMIAIAVLTRHGASSCKGFVRTPLGNGQANSNTGGFGNFGAGNNQNLTYSVMLGTACKLNTACFAVAIIGAFLFLITAAMQLALLKNHKKEKRYGPGPKNDYTEGSGRKPYAFWARKNKRDTVPLDAEMAPVSEPVVDAPYGQTTLTTPGHPNDIRPSHDTGYTGSTMAAPLAHNDKLDGRGGYYTAPVGTANPYTTTGTATNY
ncbi:hypothetical protein LTR62_004561 [Meristemomyces frigidus]|uniref:MARVEL domain-containing protein n=1 Tax=Meristemomyces frigidus TaxID=1508187 RepID=A0AAN7YP38_9PEZI|nr:hypothetical protein LTR62_004561 [Meristemomyces frigidus]